MVTVISERGMPVSPSYTGMGESPFWVIEECQ